MQNNCLFIVYSNLQPGGIPAKIIDIVNEMGKHSPKTQIAVLLQKGDKKDLRTLITNPNTTIIDFKWPQFLMKRLFFIFWLWKQILTHKPKSVLAFISPYALPVLLAKQLFFWQNMNVVVSEDHYTTTMLGRMAFPFIQKLGIRLLYPLADHIVTPTNALKKQLRSLCNPKNPIQVVPNWSRFADIKLPKTKRVYDIAHIGRLEQSKNPLQVVKIMHKYLNSNPKARCLIIGDGCKFTRIAAYIKKHNLKNILLIPAVKNVSDYLLQAKVFLFLPESTTEGFPIVLLDAMACGTLVVSKDFSGIKEVIMPKKTGCIENNQQNMLDCINRLVSNKQKRQIIIRRAKNYCKNKHSIKNVRLYIQRL